MNRLSGRVLFDLFLLSAAGWGLVLAQALPESNSPGQVSAGFFPSVVLAIGVPIMLIVLVQDLREARRTPGTTERLPNRLSVVCALIVSVLLVLYIWSLETLTFIPATGLFLFAATLVCGVLAAPVDDGNVWRRLLSPRLLGTALATAVLGSGVTYYVFSAGFGLVLP